MEEEVLFAAFRSIKFNKLVSAVAFALLGISFLASPLASMMTVSRLLGWMLLIIGVIQIVAAVSVNPGIWLHNPYFYFGLFQVIIGILVIREPYLLLDWINLIFGVILTVGSAMSFIHMQHIRHYIKSGNAAACILPAAGILLGVVIILNPFSTMMLLCRVIGIVFLYDAFVSFRIFLNMKSYLS